MQHKAWIVILNGQTGVLSTHPVDIDDAKGAALQKRFSSDIQRLPRGAPKGCPPDLLRLLAPIGEAPDVSPDEYLLGTRPTLSDAQALAAEIRDRISDAHTPLPYEDYVKLVELLAVKM